MSNEQRAMRDCAIFPHCSLLIAEVTDRERRVGQYLLRRLAISIPVLIGITLATYIIVNLAPGDPVTALISPEAAASLGPDWVAQQREQLGLNKPLPVRYVLWVKEIARGNLGYSAQDRQPIAQKIRD